MADNLKLVLPDFYVPFPSRFHEAHVSAAEAEQDVYRLLARCDPGLQARAVETGVPIARFLAPLYHDAPHDGLLLGLMYCVFFFLHDDWAEQETADGRPVRTVGELSRFYERVSDILDGQAPRADDNPLTQFMFHFRKAIADYDPSWKQHWFRAALESHLRATMWEVANQHRSSIPSFDEYVTLRENVGGQYPAFELDLLVYRINVSDRIRWHPAVRHLYLLAGRVPVWMNDIMSYPRERHDRDGRISTNLVAVLKDRHGISDQEAVDSAARIVNDMVHEYESLKARLPGLGIPDDDALRRWTERFEDWMIGGLKFQEQVPRYDLSAGFQSDLEPS